MLIMTMFVVIKYENVKIMKEIVGSIDLAEIKYVSEQGKIILYFEILEYDVLVQQNLLN